MSSIQSNAEKISTNLLSYDQNESFVDNNVSETNVSEAEVSKEVKKEEEQESKKIKFVLKKPKNTKKIINDDVNKEGEEKNKII
jgi:hypothetical protein